MIIEQLSLSDINQRLVKTPYIDDIIERAMTYIKAGFPINLSGPAGTGKTTLALYLASQTGRSVMLLHGSNEMNSSNLIGGNYGYRKKVSFDNYIHSVQEYEESLYYQWVDGMLSNACRKGMILVYDEFTRSRPEVNNLLLSILEEKILSLPGWQKDKHYLNVHPEFKAIFTSNPEEYAGVHRAQVALVDRMINLEMNKFDRDTEIAITSVKSGLPETDASFIVDIVRAFRERCGLENHVSVRSAIRIATVVSSAGDKVALNNDNVLFGKIVSDILLSEIRDLKSETDTCRLAHEVIQELIVKKRRIIDEEKGPLKWSGSW
jgi:gas vesicle protein GvpN